jgi:glycosyltransferase involved in cell wall biosynthesis
MRRSNLSVVAFTSLPEARPVENIANISVVHRLPAPRKLGRDLPLSDEEREKRLEQEIRIADYFASETQIQHSQSQIRSIESVKRTHGYFQLKIRELYWTLTRLIGLAHMHDGSRPRPSHKKRPAAPKKLASRGVSPAAPGRVFLDVTPTHRFGRDTGIQRVVREIAKRTVEQGTAFPVIIEDGRLIPYYDDPAFPPTIDIEAGDKLLLLDASWGMAEEYLPILRRVSDRGGQIISVIYDLIPLLQPFSVSADLTRRFEEWFEIVVLKSDAVMCISQCVATEFCDYIARHDYLTKPHFRVGWWRLGADFEPANPRPVSASAKEIARDDAPFFLSVGTLEPRKGYAIALAAFDILWRAGSNARYVVIGRPGWQSESIEMRIRRHPEFGRGLIWLDDASDADLRYCYERAHALVYASAFEGFGLPLVEAARHGLPIIASDLPIFHEIGGDHPRYFKLLDAADLAQKIQDALDAPTRKILAPVYTWDDSASSLINIISKKIYQERIRYQAPMLGEESRSLYG